MSLTSLLVFAAVYAVAVATPGPGVAAIVARVLARGLQGIVPFIAGFIVGDLIWFAVAATGLAVVAHEFAGLFTAIRYAGVAYLIWLAWRIWRAPAAAPNEATISGESRLKAFLGALSLTLGNPKVIVFFLSIMPLVVDVQRLSASSFLVIAAVMPSVLGPGLFAYALAANRARVLFRSARAMKFVNRGAAGIIAAAAIAIAAR
jgi:threonine/homoserine/homoserine lactone efflux protein